ncbi:hypothetical protein BTHERMOSOX_1387 [Bathymodiolus thermophilus thioautotrophic gill symbiont]|nr:hypothetical protein BTHERMOSOX_1387 [Bathymodiolus thermophilus thioautotrophic gill symbiont]
MKVLLNFGKIFVGLEFCMVFFAGKIFNTEYIGVVMHRRVGNTKDEGTDTK